MRPDALITRRDALRYLIGLCSAIGLSETSAAVADATPLRSGDVLLTRNKSFNVVPGHWNHAGLYDGTSVIHADITAGKVVAVPLRTFLEHYPHVLVRRLEAQELVPAMRKYASQEVGKPYRLVPDPEGHNCVSLLRSAYQATSGTDPRWQIPDHLASDQRLATVKG